MSRFSAGSHPLSLRPPPPARIRLGIFSRFCIRNTRTFGPLGSTLLLSRSYGGINPNVSPFSTDSNFLSFLPPCPYRLLLDVMSFCLCITIYPRLVLLCLLSQSYIDLTFILISLPFLQTPISPPFDTRLLLAVSVPCPSDFHHKYRHIWSSSVCSFALTIILCHQLKIPPLPCRLPSLLRSPPVTCLSFLGASYFSLCITYTLTLGPPLSALLFSQSRVDINPNLSPLLQTPISTPSTMVSCSSSFSD